MSQANKDEVVLIDALNNLTPQTGCTDEYCRGIIVGAVSGLMSTGLSFNSALGQVVRCAPEGGLNIYPEGWRTDVVNLRQDFSKRQLRGILNKRQARKELAGWVLHVKTTHDNNGNPRRLFLVYDKDELVRVIEEGYRGTASLWDVYPDAHVMDRQLIITPGEYQDLKRDNKAIYLPG